MNLWPLWGLVIASCACTAGGLLLEWWRQHRGKTMRMPYPFKTPVDLDDPLQAVTVKVLVDMPEPLNLPVHLANEHNIDPTWQDRNSRPLHERVWLHLEAHLYGQFREGCEHYHIKGERA